MSKVFKAIEALERDVQKVLAGQYDDPAFADFENAYVEALIKGISEATNSSDVKALAEAALAEASSYINEDLLVNIQSNCTQLVDQATEFFASVGVSVPNLSEAITRTKAAKTLRKSFERNFGTMRDELLQATIEAASKQIANGALNRSELQDAILDAIGNPMHYARTNARLVVSGYNRIWRDGVAKEVGLNWALYYGDARNNTRSFCLRCIGKVFSRTEIERMSNGQNLDVIHYAGGYNCIHSWLWVDPDWDEELEASKYNGTLATIEESGSKLVVPE